MPFPELDPRSASAALRRVGLRVRAEEVQVEARDEKWLVRLPGERVAWFAASERGRRRLGVERRVLRLLEARCSFQAPRLLFEDPAADFDLRKIVPGSCDPWRLYREVCDSAELARQLGSAVGALLAEQHTRIGAPDVDGWLPRQPPWPESRRWVRERLPSVIDDAALVASADEVLAAYEAVPVLESDRVLVHTDVGFHNLAIDPGTHAVRGIFDYEEAAWADRHHDFRYLVFDLGRDELLEAACAVYEPRVGRPIDRDRVLLYNAACAVTFLAYRAGSRPEERPCGRILAEDLRWSRHALARALAALGRSR